jgi:hypothetical protein
LSDDELALKFEQSLPAPSPRHQPVAVVLNLVNPAGARFKAAGRLEMRITPTIAVANHGARGAWKKIKSG